MKIGNTDDTSSYLNRLTQGTQNQRTQNARTSGTFPSLSSNQGSGDAVEISGQAYQSLSGGRNEGGPGGMMPPPDPSQALSSLVEDGTITSDQATAVVSAMSSSITSDTSGTKTSDSSNPLKSALDSLISAGTLTSDQADSIAGALAPPQKQDETNTGSQSGSTMKSMGPPPPPPQGQEDSASDPVSNALSSLVDAGTITSDQADTIMTALQDALESGTASGTSSTSGTSDTTSTTGTSSASTTDSTDSINPLKSLLEGLVSDGKITEDQASAVAQAMMPPPPPMDMGMSMGDSGDDNSDSSVSRVSASGSSSTTSTSGTTSASDQRTTLVKDILNSELSHGTVSTDYLSSVIKFLNSLDTNALQSIYSGLQSGTTTSDS